MEICLTIDCARNNDQLFNIFVSKIINFDGSPAVIYFQIDKVKSRANSETFGASSLLLQDGSSNGFAVKSMDVDLDLDKIGSEMIELLGRLRQQIADQLDRYFFQDDNDTQEKSKKGKNSVNVLKTTAMISILEKLIGGYQKESNICKNWL